MVLAMLIMTLYYDIPQLQCPQLMYSNDSFMDDMTETFYLAKDPKASYTMLNNSQHAQRSQFGEEQSDDDSINTEDAIYSSSSNCG